MSGTMTMAAICAMWRADAAQLRTRANALDAIGEFEAAEILAARACQLADCAYELSVNEEEGAEELALHLHTGPSSECDRPSRRPEWTGHGPFGVTPKEDAR